jgi:hypothetical protein
MATKIKVIPILNGKSAKDFIEKADTNLNSKKIDFSKKIAVARIILLKAKL